MRGRNARPRERARPARRRAGTHPAVTHRPARTDAARIRVLYVLNDLTVGGAQRALLAQAAGLDRARFDVHVASLELVAGGPLAPEFRAAGVTVHTLARPGEAFGLAPFRLHALVRRLRPDVVHTHLAAAGIAGRIAAHACGVRQVLSTLHNVSDWEERRRHPLRVLDRATLRLATRICAVSDAVRAAAARVSPRLAARTVTLYNGVDLERFAAARAGRDRARAHLGLAPADFVVATVARLEPCKGIDTLLRAAARAVHEEPSLQLLVVGDGSDRDRLEQLAESLGIAAWVTFTGTRDDVPELLVAADLFAMPSHTEGLGVAAIEALAAGLPVLASNVGGLPEIVEDGRCGRLLPVGDVAAWATAIAAAALGPATREAWRAATAARVRRFSIDASVAALEALYRTPGGGRPRRSRRVA